MGTNINATISHNLKFPPTRSLPKDMNVKIEHGNPFIRNEWAWKGGYEAEVNCRVVHNPSGHTVWLGQHAAVISTGVNWGNAATDEKLREQILSSIISIAHFFESCRIVFLPDDIEPWCNIVDSITEAGSTLDELIERLRQVQAPSPDFISAIRQTPTYKVDGYLIVNLQEPIG